MSYLSATAAQILDALVDVVTGPVVGTVTASSTSGEVKVPRGLMGTLPDGRRVRVVKRELAPTGGVAVTCRLEHLAPAIPVAQNFRSVAAGTVVTWISPPAGLAPTAIASAFGPGVRAGSMRVGSVVEIDHPPSAFDKFVAGAQGDVQLLLISPQCRRIGPDGITLRGLFEATWRLRVAFAKMDAAVHNRALARDVFDAICASAIGANAGCDDVIRITQWVPLRETGWIGAWEATLLTRHAAAGRVLRETNADFDEVLASVRIPDDDLGEGPFRDEELIDVL